MKILTDVPANSLASEMDKAKVFAKKSTLPVLEYFLAMKSKAGTLVFGSTNLTAGILIDTGRKIDQLPDMGICFPPQISELLKTWDGKADVEYSPKTGAINLGSKKTNAQLKTLPGDEYPNFPVSSILGAALADDKATRFTCNAGDLRSAIEQTAYSASRDESRPVLTAIQFSLNNEQLTLTTSDGFRLARASIGVTRDMFDDGKFTSFLAPAASVSTLCKYLQDDNASVSIGWHANSQMSVKTGNIEFFVGRIEGQFPDVDQIIPKKGTFKIELDTADFLQAVKRSLVFARDGSMIGRIVIETQDSGTVLTLKGESKETGASADEFEISRQPENITIGFNLTFMVEILSHAPPSQAVLLEMNSSTHPIKILAKDHQGTWLAILMPMQVEGA